MIKAGQSAKNRLKFYKSGHILDWKYDKWPKLGYRLVILYKKIASITKKATERRAGKYFNLSSRLSQSGKKNSAHKRPRRKPQSTAY